MSVLDSEEVDRQLPHGWTVEGNALTRTTKFAGFPDAIAAVTDIAEIAEELNHHPDIDIRWNTVTLRASTHSAGGITQLDIELAHRLAEVMGGPTV